MINERIKMLRDWMRNRGIDAFITPSTDPHSGEYVPDHWKSREWITGFTGSAGTAVVTMDKALLWTDNRYFLQAEEQLKGSEYELMKIGLETTPDIIYWLCHNLEKGMTVGFDGWCYTIADYYDLRDALEHYGFKAKPQPDPYDEIWTDRPAIPTNPIEIHPLEYAGESTTSKIAKIRKNLKENNVKAIVISMLDEVAWTLNLRGSDVQCNPVFVSYLIITDDKAVLFVNPEKLNEEVKSYLHSQGVEIRGYDEVSSYISSIEGDFLLPPDKVNFNIQNSIHHGEVLYQCSPVTFLKIFKNETEIRGYHSAMLKDGIAMVKWMKWALEEIPKGGHTELSLEHKLTSLRAEQPLFRGVSFDSIMGYAAHGAIVHYEPTEETDIPVVDKGLLLIDSGGQYLDGTTDITRTIPLGNLTYEERRDYTLVLRGFINLARAVFPRGTYGTQLDALAREPMWKYGINYLHGTGHGVGSYLNVHEGPHQFRMNYMPTPLCPSMTITDEPGIYIAGSHGVRHENTMLVVNARLKESHEEIMDLPDDEGLGDTAEGRTFGPYYQFEQLTLCPILTKVMAENASKGEPVVIKEMMNEEEITWFNQYQRMVRERLTPHLDAETATWLKEATEEL